MKNRFLYSLVFVLISTLSMAQYSGGAGTELSPYQIATGADLITLSQTISDWDKYFIQTADIVFDADETQVDWNGDGTPDGAAPEGFSAIGNNTDRFSGNYDGDNYTVSNLFINRLSESYIGLFGYISVTAEIKNIGFIDSHLVGDGYVASVAGKSLGSITNCYNTGGFKLGSNNTAGIVGENTGTVSNCYNTGPINGIYGVGGICGNNENNSSISLCYNAGVISGQSMVGGISGENYGTISKCYNTADISATADVCGGIVGSHSGTILNCYNTGNISATETIGGVAGSANTNTIITNCYNIGTVDQTDYSGAFLGTGETSTVINNSFFLSTSGIDNGYAIAKSSDKMRIICTYIDGTEASWDFMDETTNGNEDIWGMNSSENGAYPFLAWQGYEHTETLCGCDAPAGLGYENNPYQIATLCDLKWLSVHENEWDKYYIQTADIDASETSTWNNGEGFAPIGSDVMHLFSGTYDGQGYTITGIYINRPTLDWCGFFGYSSGATFINIGLIDVDITGQSGVGGMVGTPSCSFNNCFVTGQVSGINYVGGFVGYQNMGSINNCYAKVNVTRNNGTSYRFGGFSGYTRQTSSITNCYSTGSVIYSNDDNPTDKGFVGLYDNTPVFENNFFDSETSLQSSDGVGAATAKTTAEMKTLCTFIDGTEASWDFMIETLNGTDETWGMNSTVNDGYPFLNYQQYEHTASCCGIIDITDPELPTLADLTGDCSVTAIAPTTTDNCSGEITGTTSDPLEYTVQGEYTITWTFVDGEGNSIDVDQNVIVDDVTDPEIPELETLTDECAVTASVPTTNDNCAGELTATTDDPTTYTEQGEYTITWIFNDGNDNIIEVEQDVVVEDITDPEFTCIGDQVIDADATHTYTVQGTEFDPTEISDNCFENPIVENDFNNTSTLAGAQIPEGTETITWTISDNAGNSTTCEFDVVVNQFVGISDISNNGIEIYPNPTTSSIYVSVNNEKIKYVSVTDITGRKVYENNQTQQSQQTEINLSDFESGIYFITVKTDKVSFTNKVIKE